MVPHRVGTRSILVAILIASIAVVLPARGFEAKAEASGFVRSEKVALVPNPNGQEDHGGAFPTTGFPDGYAPQFSNVSVSSIRDDATNPLDAGYDTVVLNSLCQIGSELASRTFKDRIESFVSAGGKLIIWDSECLATDYTNFAIPFATNNPGQLGATGSLADVEENTLSSTYPTSASYINLDAIASQTDAVGDANVFTTFDSRWYVDLTATNAVGVDGPVHAYANLGHGLIIYSGLDKDYLGSGSFDPASASGSDQLRRVWLLELLQPWDPDGLPNSRPATGKQLRYVAMGDSFSSGEGAGAGSYFQWHETLYKCNRPGRDPARGFSGLKRPIPGWSCVSYQVSHDIGCHRAPTAWSFVIAKLSTDIRDDVENTACTGATIPENLLRKRKDNEQPQVDRLKELNRQEKVDLVTLTIGGNDIGFPTLLTECYLFRCGSQLSLSRDLIRRGKSFPSSRMSVESALVKIHEAAPDAKIAVVSYPQLVPESQDRLVGCGWLDRGERQAARNLVGDINLALWREVEKAKARGIDAVFLDISDALTGREACSQNSHVVKIYGNPWNTEQFHPDSVDRAPYGTSGQEDLAYAVFSNLIGEGIVSG